MRAMGNRNLSLYDIKYIPQGNTNAQRRRVQSQLLLFDDIDVLRSRTGLHRRCMIRIPNPDGRPERPRKRSCKNGYRKIGSPGTLLLTID